MSHCCTNPIYALKFYEDEKIHLKLLPKIPEAHYLYWCNKYGADNVLTLPCGSCLSCKMNYADDWSIRCGLESHYWKHTYFITLTYSNTSLMYASFSDVHKFLKRLKKLFGFGCKCCAYFGCQEKGEVTNRLHYHLILFTNYDLELHNPVYLNGNYHYHSRELNRLWPFGLHDIAEDKSGARIGGYIAKYIDKDHSSKKFMSRNIGYRYYCDHREEIYSDNLVIYKKFGDVSYKKVPRCFQKWFIKDLYNLGEIKAQMKEIGSVVAVQSKKGFVPFYNEAYLNQLNNDLIHRRNKKGAV